MVADILCLCCWHELGGAQLDADLLVNEFKARGYSAEVGFLFDRQPYAGNEVDSAFVVAPRAPRSAMQWLNFWVACRREIVRRRPRVIIGFQPTANVIGAIAAKFVGSCRMVATQRNPSDRQSLAPGLADKLIDAHRSTIAISRSAIAWLIRFPDINRCIEENCRWYTMEPPVWFPQLVSDVIFAIDSRCPRTVSFSAAWGGCMSRRT